MSNHICIDAGNTRLKTYVFSPGGDLLSKDVFHADQFHELANHIRNWNVTNSILATSGKLQWDYEALPVFDLRLKVSSLMQLPIKILYKTPRTLGHDRIAGACGAHYLFPRKNVLIISAGTCITMDVLLGSGLYLGGNIHPGIPMRTWAMHERTARLPVVSLEWPESVIGDSTEHALQNGTLLSAIQEVESYYEMLKVKFDSLDIILTGGDASFLAKRMQKPIFEAPDLVATGLFQILNLHVQSTH